MGATNRDQNPRVEEKTKRTLIERPSRSLPLPPSPFEEWVESVLLDDLSQSAVKPITPAAAAQSEALPQRKIRRFGHDLVRDEEPTFSPNFDYSIPPDYVLGPGDQLSVRLWGSIEIDQLRTIDRRGRISLPTVGDVSLAGVRYDQAEALVKERYARFFKNFNLSVSVERLRGIRVFVTGFAANPGTYTVSNLSTVLNVFLASGGPGQGGSFRQIDLIRNGERLVTLDSYEFLMTGAKAQDRLLQSGDVIRVGPVEKQVVIAGAVQRPAIYELRHGETVNDLLAMAGGFTEIAERGFLRLLEFQRREAGFGDWIIGPPRQPQSGDIYIAVNAAVLKVPTTNRSLRVRVHGEVNRPGEYLLPPGTDISDAIGMAGGLSGYAFPYGTVLTRLSAQKDQQDQLDRVKREMESALVATNARTVAQTPEERSAQESRTASIQRMIARLDTVNPMGRVNLATSPQQSRLPKFGLEDGDQIYIPRIPETRGVYGAVLNPGIFSARSGDTVASAIGMAGGTTETADQSRIMVIRANGTAENVRLAGSFGIGGGRDLMLLPGDTVYVAEDVRPQLTFTQELREWTQILSQFALGAAAIKVLRE